jgi:hypothetical protein
MIALLRSAIVFPAHVSAPQVMDRIREVFGSFALVRHEGC